MRGVGTALVLLLLVAGPTWAQATSNVALTATAGQIQLVAGGLAAGLTVNLTADAVDGPLGLIVTHPEGGQVVLDRAYGFTASPGLDAEVQIADVRAASEHTVRLLTGADAQRIVNRTVGGALDPDQDPGRSIGAGNVSVDVGHFGTDLVPGVAGAHFVANDSGRSSQAIQQIVTVHGDIVVVQLEGTWSKDPSPVGNVSIVARVSHDGGHSFGPVIRITPFQSNVRVALWDEVEAPDGAVAIIYSVEENDLHHSAPGHIAWLDPATGALMERGPTTSDHPLYFLDRPQRYAITSNGTLLYLEPTNPPRLWSVDPSGHATPTATFAAGNQANGFGAILALGPHDEVAVVLVQGHTDWTSDAWLSRSDDGHNFTAPQPILGLQNISYLDPYWIRIGDDGTVHMLFFHPRINTDHVANAIYTRIARNGSTTLRDLAYDPGSLAPVSKGVNNPSMSLRGQHLWIFWRGMGAGGQYEQWGSYGLESLDGGKTFGAPYGIKLLYGGQLVEHERFVVMDRTGLLPGGRPVLLGLVDGHQVVVVPFFDPVPAPEERLVQFHARSGSLEPAHWRPRSIDGPEPSLASSPPPTNRQTPNGIPGPPAGATMAAVVVLGLWRRRPD